MDQTSFLSDSDSITPVAAIEVSNLTKIYRGGKHALDDVSLTVPRGAFFGLLGPNGAGKSSLINILAGLVVKTSGSARICGYDTITQPRQARASIGVVPQELNLDPFFPARELLEMQAGLYGVPPKERRTLEILDAMGLADKADAPARSLSGGMRRRLLIAKAMVHTPPILVLDEPTAGVDVELRRSLWTYIKRLNAQGTTVLLTTHYLEEAQALCDRIVIINHGKVVANEDTPTLLRRIDAKRITVTLDQDLLSLPASLAAAGWEWKDPRTLCTQYKPSEASVSPLLAGLAAAGLTVRDLSTQESDLEDVFLTLTTSA